MNGFSPIREKYLTFLRTHFLMKLSLTLKEETPTKPLFDLQRNFLNDQ